MYTMDVSQGAMNVHVWWLTILQVHSPSDLSDRPLSSRSRLYASRTFAAELSPSAESLLYRYIIG